MLQVYEHVSPVTPEHVVGEFANVSPPLQLLALQLPPENEAPAPQMCEPDGLYPALQLNEHVAPVTPLHAVGELAIVRPPVQLLAAQLPPEKEPPAPQTCEPDGLYPVLQVYEHAPPVTPLHVVGEFASVSPPVQPPAAQLPPENEPPAPQTCEPDALYPVLQVYEHVSPVTPEHVVGEFDIESPPLQLLALQLPPENEPPAPQTCEPDALYPALQLNEHVAPVTPEHVVGELAIVSPPLQLFALQLPPENEPPAPQT